MTWPWQLQANSTCVKRQRFYPNNQDGGLVNFCKKQKKKRRSVVVAALYLRRNVAQQRRFQCSVPSGSHEKRRAVSADRSWFADVDFAKQSKKTKERLLCKKKRHFRIPVAEQKLVTPHHSSAKCKVKKDGVSGPCRIRVRGRHCVRASRVPSR